jgi:hypothetical protein
MWNRALNPDPMKPMPRGEVGIEAGGWGWGTTYWGFGGAEGRKGERRKEKGW